MSIAMAPQTPQKAEDDGLRHVGPVVEKVAAEALERACKRIVANEGGEA